MRIDDVNIDEHIEAKLWRKHGVSFDEVIEVLESRPHLRRSRGGLVKAFGRTSSGRRLIVVLAEREIDKWFVVTGRDMTGSEIRLYRRHGG